MSVIPFHIVVTTIYNYLFNDINLYIVPKQGPDRPSSTKRTASFAEELFKWPISRAVFGLGANR